MDLRELQGEVAAWIAHDMWPPLANLARLSEEVGELAREINGRYGPKAKRADGRPGDLALELGDVVFTLAALAVETGVDLEAAFVAVMEKYRGRDAGRSGGPSQT